MIFNLILKLLDFKYCRVISSIKIRDLLCITLYIRAPVDSSGFLSLIGLLCLNIKVSIYLFNFDWHFKRKL